MELKTKRYSSSLFAEITEIPEILRQSYFPSLDGFRAVSIALVIVFHLLMSLKPGAEVHAFASLGVQFFFVISGFLITTLLLKERMKTGTISLKKFYIRRFFRILPVAYLYLVVVIILGFLMHLHLSPIYIVTSFLFVRNFFMTSQKLDHISTHYWSLSVEEQFYLIFPVIVKKNFKAYICFLIGLIALGIVDDFTSDFAFLKTNNNSVAINFLIQFLNEFQGIAIGSLLSILVIKRFIVPPSKWQTPFIIILTLAIILVTFYGAGLPYIANMVKSILFGFILITCLRPSESFFFKFLNNSKIKLIGMLSFSIYIWQQPFTLNLRYVSASRLISGISANKVLMDILIIGISFFLLFTISYLSYNFFEKRFLKLRETFRR